MPRSLPLLTLFLLSTPSLLASPPPTTQSLLLTPGPHPLLDRQLIAESSNLTHTLHSPTPRNIVLTLDKPWEGRMSAYGTLLRTPDGQVRLYYRGGGDVDPPEVTCLATSDDGGVHFTRPSLHLYTIRGTTDNNVVFTAAPDRPSYGQSHNFAPFLDTNPATPPSARYKAVALQVDRDDHGDRRRMLSVLASPDGIHWSPLADKPVLRTGSFDSLNVPFFDPNTRQYVCYFRVGRDGRRSFARAHSPDFLAWTLDPPLTFLPPQDEQWYTNAVTPYPDGAPNLYLALPMRFVPERKTVGNPPRKTDGLSDAVLLSSRDGLTWDRNFRQAFLRPGPDPANWGDAHGNNTPLTNIIPTSPSEWSVYWFEGSATGAPPHIRRGTLRPDGLASLHATADPGHFTTPPSASPRTSPTPPSASTSPPPPPAPSASNSSTSTTAPSPATPPPTPPTSTATPSPSPSPGPPTPPSPPTNPSASASTSATPTSTPSPSTNLAAPPSRADRIVRRSTAAAMPLSLLTCSQLYMALLPTLAFPSLTPGP